jgi:hypothetical protein
MYLRHLLDTLKYRFTFERDEVGGRFIYGSYPRKISDFYHSSVSTISTVFRSAKTGFQVRMVAARRWLKKYPTLDTILVYSGMLIGACFVYSVAISIVFRFLTFLL